MSPTGRVTIGGAGLAAIAAVFVLLSSGCGYGGVASAASHPDTQAGKALFIANPNPGGLSCGSCHTLQDAGTHGTIGPNLDNAFAGSRSPAVPASQAYGLSTIENVVLDQIRLGSISPPLAPYKTESDFTSKKCLDPSTKQQCLGTEMPANIYTGQDAIDVAAYVAEFAGASGFTESGPLGNDGAAIFKGIGCAGCHTLNAAGSTGTTGPNLDQIANALTLAIVVHQVQNGGGVMPAFKTKLTAKQIQAVAQYVIANAGK